MKRREGSKPIEGRPALTKTEAKAKKDQAQRKKEDPSTFSRLFGFDLAELSSWSSFCRLLHRPADPASLSTFRFCFGFLMTIDCLGERGMSNAEARWADPTECRFPLFNSLPVMPMQYMYCAYVFMLLGALGICLGFLFRLSCMCFVVPYWYIIFLDKTSWNNHSYLFGLTATVLMFSSANKYMSLDALIWPSKHRNKDIPLWNYTLVRFQLFLVYFIAGLKKLDPDWYMGYSMGNLSRNWVFTPFKFVLPDWMIDLFVVHIGGLCIDLFGGFGLFFDLTRPLTIFAVCMFHAMNSQLFSIGMFSYTMLSSTSLFCYADWPRHVFPKLPRFLSPSYVTEQTSPSPNCIYDKTSDKRAKSSSVAPPTRATWKHSLTTCLVLLYMTEQVFLPYSHFITKGYNNWTNGLYGYSWDMMIHAWSTQHVRIKYINPADGEDGFLNPAAWTRARRWRHGGDMLKQHAKCIQRNLQEHNVSDASIYYDIWVSMNDRFHQRIFDPRVDMTKADWFPFTTPSYLMPLLTGLSDWRGKLDQITTDLRNLSDSSNIIFVADVPGLTLENFVQPDLTNTSLEVLNGQVIVELVDQEGKNMTLSAGDKLQVPHDEYHNVHVISDGPACYMYVYINTTNEAFKANLTKYMEIYNGTIEDDGTFGDLNSTDNAVYQEYMDHINQKREKQTVFWVWSRTFWARKVAGIRRGLSMGYLGVKSAVTNVDLRVAMNETFGDYETFINSIMDFEAWMAGKNHTLRTPPVV